MRFNYDHKNIGELYKLVHEQAPAPTTTTAGTAPAATSTAGQHEPQFKAPPGYVVEFKNGQLTIRRKVNNMDKTTMTQMGANTPPESIQQAIDAQAAFDLFDKDRDKTKLLATMDEIYKKKKPATTTAPATSPMSAPAQATPNPALTR